MKKLCFLLGTILFLAACNSKENRKFEIADKQEIPLVKPVTVDSATSNNSTTFENWDKQIIKTANLTVEVNDYKKFKQNLQQAVTNLGGFIADEEQVLTNNHYQTTATLRVPVAYFNKLIDFFDNDSISIIQKKISSSDVGAEMVDVAARMEAKKQIKQQYVQLLQQAKNMEDVLHIQNEINAIQEQIEAAAGRKNYLNNATAFSTIFLTYSSKEITEAATTSSFANQATHAFSNGFSIVKGLLVFIINIWPFLIVGAVLLWLWRRKKLVKKKQNL